MWLSNKKLRLRYFVENILIFAGLLYEDLSAHSHQGGMYEL